eukprot:2666903-Amphidinium_carterae.1
MVLRIVHVITPAEVCPNASLEILRRKLVFHANVLNTRINTNLHEVLLKITSGGRAKKEEARLLPLQAPKLQSTRLQGAALFWRNAQARTIKGPTPQSPQNPQK